MDGQVIIISAPSGTGKSMWLAELVAKERIGGRSVHVCSAVKTYEAFLQCVREHFSRDNTRFHSPVSLLTLFGPDIAIHGKDMTKLSTYFKDSCVVED